MIICPDWRAFFRGSKLVKVSSYLIGGVVYRLLIVGNSG